ncbi:14056_t:CDS:2 [Funneliformis caledonium]|uniref:14056_t:CDS:1 n=1 Tax=Funneliformis caledonium TaxID=1117310 RepID=A0A9N9CFF2_9GLOM|nr:14056_t:CDS:2 [Funneliformis caledonium]
MDTLKGPKELNEPYFTLEFNLEPSDLVQASKRLLSCLSPKLKQSFHLVVFFKEKAYFWLCLDTSLWFDIYLRTMPDFAEAVRIAREYVTTTRLNVSSKDEAPFIIDYKGTEKGKAFDLYPYFPNCKFTKEECSRRDHPNIVCKADMVIRNGRKVKCNFYFATKLVVNKLSDDEYVVLLFRELLLIPRPNDDKSVNYRHYNTEALVQEEGFWKDLLTINYKAWETGQLQNKYIQECYVHVYLYFILKAWNEVKEKVKKKVKEKVEEKVKEKVKKKGKEKVEEKIEENADILLKFDARDHPRPNYLLQDYDELKEKRLRPAEHLLMLDAMTNLTLKIDENNKNFIEKIDENNKNLIETMNKNTILLVEAIKGIRISGESKESSNSDITGK